MHCMIRWFLFFITITWPILFFKILNSIERNTLYNLNWLPGEIFYLQLNLNLCTPFLWHNLCIVGRRGTNHILTNIFRKLDKCILQFVNLLLAIWRSRIYPILVHCWEERSAERWREGTCRFGSEPVAGA